MCFRSFVEALGRTFFDAFNKNDGKNQQCDCFLIVEAPWKFYFLNLPVKMIENHRNCVFVQRVGAPPDLLQVIKICIQITC